MESSSVYDMNAIENMLYDPLPTLQEMAAIKIALTSCYSASSSGEYSNLNTDLVDSSSVPPRIKVIIKTYIDLIEKEIYRWLDYHNCDVFEDMSISYDFNREHIYYCVWKPNGKIDDKKTAQNLCLNGNFSRDHKFGIMCKYCLKDEIDGTSLCELSRNFIQSTDFRDCCLLYYWICYKKNKLHKIPVEDSVSVDEFMLNQNAVWVTWASAEYFWDRVSANDQVTLAQKLLLDDGEILNQQKRLWCKMNNHQRSSILSVIPVKIIVNFWKELLEFKLAHAIWMQIKHAINAEQFAELMRMLTIASMYSQGDDMLLLIDIWNSAADHLKNYLLYNKIEQIIKLYCTPYSFYQRNLKLLLVMLTYASEEHRRRIIMKFGRHLAHYNEHSVIIDTIMSYS